MVAAEILDPPPAKPHMFSLDQDPAVQEGVEALIQRLRASQGAASADSAVAAPATPRSGPSSNESPFQVVPSFPSSPESTVQRHIRRLEEESKSPNDAAMEHLRRFAEKESFRIGGDAKVRVAPGMIAKLYRHGRTATR